MKRLIMHGILNKIRFFGLLLFYMSIAGSAIAQAIVWQVRPSEYDDIEYLGRQLYQVRKNAQVGLIKSDGSVVVPAEYTEITPFYEQKALVLNVSSGQTIVCGYVNDNGVFTQFPKTYYLIKDFPFYSNGMLTATNAEGQLGYLDEFGNEALGFDGSFSQITPFTEGFASVFKGRGEDKKYFLVNKSGSRSIFHIGLGEVYRGTNVYNGSAVIWDTDGNFYSYKVSSGQCSKIGKPKDFSLDYLYCLSNFSGRTRNIPYQSLGRGREGLAPQKGPNGLYGYVAGANEIMPCQFPSATPFIDDVAVVAFKGGKGMLKYVAGNERFSVSVPNQTLSYQAGGSALCSFSLAVPEPWRNSSLQISVTDSETGETMQLQHSQQTYSFKTMPQRNEKVVALRVVADDLELWSGQATYKFRRIDSAPRISISIAGDIANKDNQIPVTATITNPGTETIAAVVHMTGSNTFAEKHTNVTISAGGSVTVHSYFTITHDVSGQSVHVTTSKGGSASRTGLKFESYN